MTRFSIVLVSSIVLLGSACKGKEEGGGSAAKSAEGKAGPVKIDKLKLQIDVAGDPTVGPPVVGDGVMLQGGDVGALQIESPKTAQTLDEAKSDASIYTPKNLKGETLPDGWSLTFDNTGSMGANYFVQVRRDIGGKTYMCSTTVGDAAQAKAAVAACKTLRP